jgi:hypothetical protein
MTLSSVPIDSITEDHLLSLIEDQVPEQRVIEYKRELPGNSNDQKREFLADVCALANTAGGDLVYGMTESGGMPQELRGFETGDIDAARLRLEHLIRDGIGPRISGVSTQPVKLRNGNHALVLRVPRSFSRPHVVTFNRHWRFYARNSGGKYPLEVDEIRQAFALSESVADRIRSFRADRLGRVVSGETPAAIKGTDWSVSRGTGRVVLHMLPLSAFDSPPSVVDLDVLPVPLSPLNSIGGMPRYNFDGLVCDGQSGSEVVGYVQLFRSGIIEAVDNTPFAEREEGFTIASTYLEESLIEAVERYFELLRTIGVAPPVYLMLSLLSVRGYQMLVPDLHMRFGVQPIDRDDLVIPEGMVESLEQDRAAVERHMRPLLDAVWNACGFVRSPNYDESGHWNPRR